MNIDIIDIDTVDASTVKVDGVTFNKADCAVSAFQSKHAQIVADGETYIASIGSSVDGRRPDSQAALLYAINALLHPAIVSVRDFGAVGDGATDDTAAFLAAINTGKRVYVPPVSGGYLITSIDMTGKVLRLFGDPSVSVTTGYRSRIISVAAEVFADPDRVEIDGVMFFTTNTGDDATPGSSCLHGYIKGMINRCQFEGFYKGIDCPTFGDSLTVTNSSFRFCHYGWHGKLLHTCKSICNWFWHCQYGLYWDKGESILVQGNSILSRPGAASTLRLQFNSGLVAQNYFEFYAVSGDARNNDVWIHYTSNKFVLNGITFDSNYMECNSRFDHAMVLDSNNGVIPGRIRVLNTAARNTLDVGIEASDASFADLEIAGSSDASASNTLDRPSKRNVMSSVAATPAYVGQFAVASGVGYMATGTASSADWKQVTA